MSRIVEQIKEPIRSEMQIFERKFYEAMRSKVPLLDRITHFIVRRKGKQMRPMLVFLSAKMLGNVDDKVYRAASLVELIHTATLVHDDVVDDSFERRGFFSINALWKNKIAVLVGDYLLSKSVLLATDNENFDLLAVVSRAIREMSEGELLQLEKARKLDITEEVYLEVIRQKTASLLSACCEIGATAVHASDEEIQQMAKLGEFMGMAFQIKDDLFDYTHTNLLGKPVGIDIKEQKLTLPLIHTLSTAPKSDRNHLIDIIKNQNHQPKKVREVIHYVIDNGGLKYAQEKMMEYKSKAEELLFQFPKNSPRDAMELMISYVIERRN